MDQANMNWNMQDSSELQLLVMDGRYKTTTVVAGQLPQ